MSGERNVIGREPAPDGHEDIDLEQEGRLAEACASLRLLGGEGEALSLDAAIARGLKAGDDLRRWEASGAPINDVVVRLSDGGEVQVEKKNFETDLFMYGFNSILQSGAVLQFCRRADRDYDEVLLLTVATDAVGPRGLTYKKKYSNNQVLRLRVNRLAGSLFQVGVEWTQPQADNFWLPSRWPAWVGALVVAGVALLSAAYRLRRKLYRDESGMWQPTRASLVLMMVISVAAFEAYQSFIPRKATTVPRQDSVFLREGPGAQVHNRMQLGQPSLEYVFPEHEPSTQHPFFVQVRDGDKSSGRESTTTFKSKEKIANGHPALATGTVTDRASGIVTDTAESCPVTPREVQNPWSMSAAAVIASDGQVGTAPVRAGGSPVQAPPVAVRSGLIPIYVKAHVSNDKDLEAKMLRTFVNRLKATRMFDVMTDESGRTIPRGIYEVNLEFDPMEGCQGVIFVRLYDKGTMGGELWRDEKDCRKYPKGKMFALASREVLASIIPRIVGPNEDSGKSSHAGD